MITMSALPRLLACPGSAALPRAEVASVWADLGNEEHADLSVLGDLPPELAALVPAGARAEVKVAYDVATRIGRIIGEGAGRGYGAIGPFEIAGSVDVLGDEDDAVIIIDWKTGYNDVEPAATNGQLWGYGLAAARALGKSRAILMIVYTKTGRVDRYEADELELAAFAARLERLHVDVARLQATKGEPVSTSEGSWCRHCPGKASCPSKNALLVQIAAKGLAVIGDAEMNPMRAAAAYREVARVDQLVKDAKGRIRAYVETVGPIPLGDGRFYGRHRRPGDDKIVDVAKVDQAIAEIVGESSKEFVSVAFERSTSKAAIGRAAKAVVQKGHTVVARKVIERARALGGIQKTDEYPIGEFTGDPAPLPEIDADEIDRLLGGA